MSLPTTQWAKKERDQARKLLDLHERLDKAITPGGLTTDVVADLLLTKEEVAILMVAIECFL